jgi:hypothetical protein|tara:strand:+ start:8079 stop:9557 length:1479 start_codon:yes stop_codon:yes gene_type:complete
MQTFPNCSDALRVNSDTGGRFQTGKALSQPLTRRTLNALYAYPQRIKIKWDMADDLNDDICLQNRYNFFKYNFPFIDFFEDFLFTNKRKTAPAYPGKYSTQDFIDGYLNKIETSEFYSKQTQPLQDSIANIPVYAVVNGFGEVTVSQPRRGKFPGNRLISAQKYNIAGAFDADVVKSKGRGIGLFFMNLADAELYINEMGIDDMDGTEFAGLSIQCIGLDAAYRITRESHPGSDFRFVPDYREVTNLLSEHIGEPDLLIEDEQQQLRFRNRVVPIIKGFGKLGNFLTPFRTFILTNEYFKGVPIYVVQALPSNRGLLLEGAHLTLGEFDGLWGRLVRTIDRGFGFGANWIMQGTLSKMGQNENLKTYVFFERGQADSFCKSLDRKAVRLKGSRSFVENLVRKPKIMIHNLEDFLELWEDAILDEQDVKEAKVFMNGLFNSENIFFVPSTNGNQDFRNPPEVDKKARYQQGLRLRWSQFKGFMMIFFGPQAGS